MPQVVNTNVLSLNAQRNLDRSQGALAQALQRLSSGLRINSAKDDAAGLAISERFTTQIRGLNQAVRNANDGISLSQTAESALVEVTSNLQRIRELAVQSANASNSASDRQAIDNEVRQRLAEIERIGTQTTFNGQRVLDGSFGTALFQVGPNVGETISVALTTGIKASQIGQIATLTGASEVTVANLTGSGTIAVGSNPAQTIAVASAGTLNGQTVGSAFSKAIAIGAAGVPGLSVAAVTTIQLDIAATTGTSAGDTYSLRLNGADIFATYDQVANGVLSSQDITDAINVHTNTTGVTATLNGTDLRLTAADGRDIAIAFSYDGTGSGGGVVAASSGDDTINGILYRAGTITTTLADANANSVVIGAVNGGTITLTASENISVNGDGTILGFANANFTLAKDTTTILSANVLTVLASNNTINRIDAALTTVSAQRSSFGAIQNRFESTISNLTTISENLSAARSRILDADFAAETAALTRAQILQQAGIAILAQANAAPQSVLGLLQ